MLWKTLCEALESLAWRGLQHGACKRGSTSKKFAAVAKRLSATAGFG